MKINYYTCDHCGKKLDAMHDYVEINIEAVDWIYGADLCVNCYDELKKNNN